MGKEDADTLLICTLKALHLKKQRASLPSTPFILAAVDAVSPPGVMTDWNLRKAFGFLVQVLVLRA